MKGVLYKRITEQGTISEPGGKPDPQYALPSTVNWMRALALLVGKPALDFRAAKAFYATQSKRSMDVTVENTVLEQLFLSLHHLSALEQIVGSGQPADTARIGVLAWYYGIANAASAMTAAQNGSFQEDHSGTAAMWDRDIAARGLAMEPFSWRVSNLIEATFKPEVDRYRAGSAGVLLTKPTSAAEARGAAAGYLSGSAKWYAWRVAEDVRRTPDFKSLKVTDFRTKAARELRNARLQARPVGFLHEAARYRGKANYREALFLAHGRGANAMLEGFVADQVIVLRAFLAMAGAFTSAKLGKSLWNEFVADVEAQRAFSTSVATVWS